MSAAPRSGPVRRVRTDIASHDLHHIWVRGLDLTAEVMGQVSFGEMVFLLVAGRRPDAEELHLVDAMLVALVEHGLTPSAMVARVTYSVAPESLQGAVAAGLLGAGSVVLGSMEECGRLLTRASEEVAAGRTGTESLTRIIGEHRAAGLRLPGIGHAIHTEGDPRAARLYALAEEYGRRSEHLDALEELADLHPLARQAAAGQRHRRGGRDPAGTGRALAVAPGLRPDQPQRRPRRPRRGGSRASRSCRRCAGSCAKTRRRRGPESEGRLHRARPHGQAHGRGRAQGGPRAHHPRHPPGSSGGFAARRRMVGGHSTGRRRGQRRAHNLAARTRAGRRRGPRPGRGPVRAAAGRRSTST